MTLLTISILCTVVLLSNFQKSDALKCEEVDFCKFLRERNPVHVYIVDPYTITIDDIGIITFQLTARSGLEDLKVEVYALKDDILRIKIKDLDSSRYELTDIFVEAPSLAGVQSVSTEALRMTITTNIGSRIIVQFAPFNLEFYREDVLELTLDGSRLYIDNSENSHWFSVGISYNQAHHLYGLGQHPTGLNLRFTDQEDPYRLYNLERPNYPLNETASVYGVIPLVYGHGPIATAGTFLHNAAQQFVDILPNGDNPMAFFMAEAGTLDLFVFLGPTPFNVMRQYLLITGTPQMPPLWSLGFHHSRYTYLSQEDVKEVVANFDNYNFPLDAIWLDIDHTDGNKYFTWDPETFSDPIEMQRNISATHRKLVAIIDPHVKVDYEYSVYTAAFVRGLFVKNPDETTFEGNCLPGLSSYFDFLNYETTSYYASLFTYENFPSTSSVLAGIWNDMNEPTVYDLAENTLPGELLHYGGVKHRELHNAYGMLQTRATWEGLIARDNRTVRPFVLSRSFFAGSQRYTAVWSGDSTATFAYLAISIPICLNSNILGVVFCGGDVGGFNSNPNEELFQRWYQLGAWLPFFRAHSGKDTNRREPYLWSEDVQKVVRETIYLRYKHLPVWYTLFHEHIVYKVPVIRPLFFHYTYDSNVFTIDNEFLVGQNILVRPVTEEGVTSVPVYFPGNANDVWYPLNDSDSFYYALGYVDVDVDINSIPVYYRGGSIISRKETARATTEDMQKDGYTLIVNADINNKAHGTLYLDDSTSFLYLDWVEYNYISFDYVNGLLSLTKIDEHANSDNFDFDVDLVIVRIVDPTENGKFLQTAYKMDINGNLLSDYKFNFKNQTQFQLKLH